MERPKPTISVVTICLNARATIQRTIESVLNQTAKPYEYIIIDGGSTDGTLDILNSYRSDITHIITEADRGISDAFNKGIAFAHGDFIGLLNADDWYSPLALQLVEDRAGDADLVHGMLQYWRGPKKDYLAEGNHNLLAQEMTINHPTMFVRKRLYEEVGGYNSSFRFAMDYEMVLRLMARHVRCSYIPKVLANMSFEGTSDRNWRRAIEECYRAKIENGFPQPTSYLYYIKQVSRGYFSRALVNIGFSSVVKYYRRHFSMVKKH